MNRKLIFILCINLWLTTNLFAQRDYSTGLGLRNWPYWGITIKQFVSNRNAVEGIVTPIWGGLMMDGLYEIHQDAFKSPNFNLLYGFGGNVGWWGTHVAGRQEYQNDKHFSLGIDLIIGVEYTFDEIPFSISADWKPLFIFIENADVDPYSISFSFRYNFK